MFIFRDRFLLTVLMCTGVIILGMFIFHKTHRDASHTYTGAGTTSAISPQFQRDNSSKELVALPSKGPFRITRVIDGDTIVLDNGETVRLIGVDAPETHHPEIPVQRFGEEATEFLQRMAEGFQCMLEFESGDLRDKYGRLLAYVFVDGRLLNAEMIRRGYAYVYTRFPCKRQAEFIALERQARETQSGLWHISLRDGRIANLVNRYNSLSIEGRKRLDDLLEELVRKYPYDQAENIHTVSEGQ
ncbi:MAG: thermonuclease family protein [bacterium]